jgi:hypothetical protein
MTDYVTVHPVISGVECVDIEPEISIDYTPSTRATWHHPGDPETAEWDGQIHNEAEVVAAVREQLPSPSPRGVVNVTDDEIIAAVQECVYALDVEELLEIGRECDQAEREKWDEQRADEMRDRRLEEQLKTPW